MSALPPLPRPTWLPESAWPWPTGQLSTPDGPLAVTDTGTGPTLLLTNVGMWSFVWRDLIRELARDFRCVTLDAPGNGRSYRPAPPGPTLRQAADAIGTVIDRLDLHDLTLVAHDLAGPAAIAAAGSRAERIAGIAAVNTFAWRPTGKGFRGMLGLMGSAPMRGSDAATGWLPRATSGRFGAGRHWSRTDRAVFRAGIDRAATRNLHRYLADARHAEGVYADAEAALRGPLANRPLVTIFGQYNDPLRFQPRWRTLYPTARQHVVPKGGHFPMCDAPAAVAGWLRAWHQQIRVRTTPAP
jgi:pimeloyl-ACP methyl ester carboxylesterase